MDLATITQQVASKGYASLTQGQKDIYNAQPVTAASTGNYALQEGDYYGVYDSSGKKISAFSSRNAGELLPKYGLSPGNLGSAPTTSSISAGVGSVQAGLDALIKSINTNGITDSTGKVLLAPNSGATAAGGIPTITPQSLANTPTPITIPTGTGSTSTANAVVAGADAASKSIQDYINMLNGQTTNTKTQFDDLMAQVQGLLPSAGGRGAAQLQAEQATNVPGLSKSLADVNAQILQKTAEFKARQADYAKLNQTIEGKPITMNSIIGQQAQVNKMALAEQNAAAADIGLLQASAQTIQGDLTLAQNTANRAVDLKFQDVEDTINLKLKQLDLIQEQLTKEEKIRADAITLYLQDQQQQISDQKATEKQLINFNLDAMSKYPSAGIGINDSYAITQKKILGSKEYQLATTQTTATNQPSASENRDTIVSQFLESKKGTDGYVSAEVYQESLRKFIANGGTQSNFLASFQPQTYLRKQEIDKLPASLVPQTTVTKSDLTPEQTSIINDAKAAIDQVRQRYGDVVGTRQQIIEQAKQYGFDISPYI